MSTEVILPKLGFTMTEGLIVEWMVTDGGEVKEGEPLMVVESDKSTTEIEAPASGTLKILKPLDTTLEVGTIVAEIT
ncbi:MAG: pyruvate/2-oxoglutarate dehydrogenase complex dihydrolipoamide acyltransferase (E2) component [Zhongshania sp.]|jgi:pyruvate/2-oxoglutarate dehydrogenase complex dihydrolipoamide acyltransferase (E2) component